MTTPNPPYKFEEGEVVWWKRSGDYAPQRPRRRSLVRIRHRQPDEEHQDPLYEFVVLDSGDVQWAWQPYLHPLEAVDKLALLGNEVEQQHEQREREPDRCPER